MRVVSVVLQAYGRGIRWELEPGETIADCPIVDTLAQWKKDFPACAMHIYGCEATMEDGRTVEVRLP